ncbi:MAG: hypothetical protein E5V93_25105, partial [Mesorhizobium sp.]
MTSVNQTLPGFASTQPRPHAAGDKDKDQSFGEMVRETEKPQDKHTTVLPGAHLAKRSAADNGKQEPDQDPQGKTGSQKAAGKSTRNAAARADEATPTTDKDATAQASDSVPLQDRLPLLMALSDMKH